MTLRFGAHSPRMRTLVPLSIPASIFLLILPLIGCGRTSSGADAEPGPLDVRKIYFMFHPVCWQTAGLDPPPGDWDEHSPYSRPVWDATYRKELEVNRLQKDLMSRMKRDEVLLLFPIGDKTPMLELQDYASRTLGRRAILVDRELKQPPAEWRKLDHPLERFLSEPDLPGRDEFLDGVPAEIREELAAEIREAIDEAGAVAATWNPAVLEVLYFSRLAASDIRNEFRKRNLRFDAATTQGVAFGEGFEQCAMTYKQMLVPYLGLQTPVDNRYDLSVSGASFLMGSRFRERVDLDPNLRLYLWEATGGRLVGLYTRAWCRLKDPLLYARIPVRGLDLQVREVHGKLCWPEPDAPELALDSEGGELKLPVYNGIRRDFDWYGVVNTAEDACYVIARNMTYGEFRRLLVDARISR
ncbi:MAG: hypothetical protein OXH11_13670 [Candidatus Aminicenantes bacterium]|nr:hypothetical protein [Candidatus Aminicenantes bacterium]